MLPTYIFWIGFAVILYTYIGYGILLLLLVKLKGARSRYEIPPEEELPEVTIVVAAYNEGKLIEQKINDCLGLAYPGEKLHLLFVTDGSTDETPDIVRTFGQVQLYHEPMRKGKIHAVNRVMKYVRTPITVFCDANTFLNSDCLKYMVRHYRDEKIGGVAGEKRILTKAAEDASATGEGLYWRYESFLKKKDAELYSVVGAAGELFSIRTELYEAPPEDTIIEDFYLSLRVVGNGYRFEYEPEAYALESASASVEEEWKRKVRISAGGFQAMGRLLHLLNPLRYGVLTFQYFSHRVLRWTLAPLALPLVFLSNLYLALEGLPLYKLILAGQTCFYILAVAGYLLRNRKISIKGFFVPYYFVMMNAAVYAGLARYMRGGQSVLWERAERAEFRTK